jgi:PKD repeat protein
VCTNNAPPEVPNIVTALNQYIATLQNPYAVLTDRATAFRYVLHFVGDSTQPLHCSNGISTNHPPPSGDGGGNEFTIHGTWSSLHPLWDDGGGYLNDSGVNRPMQASGYAIISNKAADVEATYPYTPSIGTVPDPMTWATDTYYYAQTVAYVGITEGGTPTTSYLNSASSCSKQRMAAGGKRLADLLMTIIVTNVSGFTASTTNGPSPLPVTFTDASTGSITNWFWNFGDGKTTNFTASTNPTHTYAAGTYNVTLIVNGYGGLATNIQSSLITSAACTPPTASVSGDQTICPAGSATIHAALTGTGSWNVTWLDGAGGTNYIQNGVAASPATRTVSPSSSTTYTVTAVSDASGCSGGTSSGSATVTVDVPATPTAGNNGPICSGSELDLSTPTVAGATYSWTGPAFTSTQQNPSIPGATTAASGTYSVTITDSNGCTSAAGSTTATVNAIPATPTASNNGPICSGGTLTLNTPAVAGASYSWTGPNGFTSTDQNPSIPNATSAAAGTYSVTVTDANGCTSAAGSTTALVMAPQIMSITKQGSDIVIAWATIGGTTNRVQATPGNPAYNTDFINISDPLFIIGSGDTSTNYTDPGATTNWPVKFYRVWLVP